MHLVLCLSSTMKIRKKKKQTWVLKLILTLFSALSDLALQCSTVLSNAFRMIYLSMHFETIFFFLFFFSPLSLATVLLNTHVYLLKCISLGMEMQNISAGFVKFTTSLICEKYLRYRHCFNSAGRKKKL